MRCATAGRGCGGDGAGQAAEPTAIPNAPLAERGEAAAEAFLRRLGFVVLARNYRVRFGEVDLVALDGDVVVFVEVKARRATDGRPAEAVTPRKQRRIGRVALAWLARREWLERDCRFDVVEVIAGPGPLFVRHLPDAFRL